jgi:hypothetical protein
VRWYSYQYDREWCLIGIKTSFEDEGALFNETIRLKEICNQAKTKLTLKIGGPEAIRDIKDALIIGVKGLVAPMVESEFGLKKFIQSAQSHIPSDVLSSLHLSVLVGPRRFSYSRVAYNISYMDLSVYCIFIRLI